MPQRENGAHCRKAAKKEKRSQAVSARRVHPAGRTPPEARCPPLKRKDDSGSPVQCGRLAGKTQAGEKRPANRKGKRVYTGEDIASLRLDPITKETAEKLKKTRRRSG
ncbi:MAG: hypothetical protein LBK73_15310 [Treponema sp.]|nr:hypothetical protein [Treponema sp.]